ncbi:MAG TPA: polyprenyl synthetase family protein [Chitinophagaceae bacterium]|nr:MAG: geranyltranstransferase [Bacteroidetes bacterium OLB11]HMN32850.1 polyprenyl synthetase family protein [Chitinophagaceae bacterium]
MQTFSELLKQFENYFSIHHFPNRAKNLYEPCSYLLNIGGKRIRPVLCLMSHELYNPLSESVWNAAVAIELFHNFTLMHDDIMDKAPLRRGVQTVHEKYDLSTAILSGDVMNIFTYVHLSKIDISYLKQSLELFNKTAIQICEGQQFDMDFEKRNEISVEEYLNMIQLKTSVLLGMSLKLGALLGGATDSSSDILFDFGKEMGIAFQMKDDYLDAFGDSQKTGKQIGGDILCNKKTYLYAKGYEIVNAEQKEIFNNLLSRNDPQKVNDTIAFYEKIGAKEHLLNEVISHTHKAFELLEEVPVVSKRKFALRELAENLLNREY